MTKVLLFNVFELFQAKALDEKNKRDLLAQREQAERNVNIMHGQIFQNYELNLYFMFQLFIFLLDNLGYFTYRGLQKLWMLM